MGIFAFHRDKNERRDGKIFSAVEGKLEAGAECRCDCGSVGSWRRLVAGL